MFPHDKIIYQIRDKCQSKTLYFVFSGQQLRLEISVENASEKETWQLGQTLFTSHSAVQAIDSCFISL